MATLEVSNFSCLDSATLAIGKVTIIIGPQASGKSVLSKLTYFFYDVLASQYLAIEDDKSFLQFSAEVAENFSEWFPPGAWGAKKFQIKFMAGPYEVSILKSATRRPDAPKVKVSFSKYFEEQYNSNLDFVRKASEKSREAGKEPGLSREIDIYWRMRQGADRKLARDMGGDYVEFQFFVPAGRSFFTSVGKAVAALEHGRILDPVTVKFGRLFTSVRERHMRHRYIGSSSERRDTTRTDLSRQLFGGEIKFDREKEYVETTDGRRVPFSALSSGQQELLPLWMVLDVYAHVENRSYFVYVEEPEAHLFPSAQSLIIEYLASIANLDKKTLLITTHSPYVLSKLNVLLKAGNLGTRATRLRQQKVNSVVPKEAWLSSKQVRAYAIVNRNLQPIINGDGLIDGEYLDSISNEISNTFSELLDIQYPDEKVDVSSATES